VLVVIPVVVVVQGVEKEKQVATTQEHKKPTSKRNLRNSKPKKICCLQH
jgi:hypothetical protein